MPKTAALFVAVLIEYNRREQWASQTLENLNPSP
jgi:hypothetical protein